MDQKILQKIFESCTSVMKELEKKKKIEKVVDSFPVLDQTSVSALASSLSKLLSYKVSPDAYQRYSARIQIIELMRDWIQPPLGLSTYPTFHQGENMAEFILILIKKYLNRDTLLNQNNTPKNLVKLGKLLFNLSKQNAVYVRHFKMFLEKIESSELSCNETYDFVNDVLNSRDELELEPSLVDKLHAINAKQFIETPLIDNFIMNFETLKTKGQLSTSDEFERMITLISSSPRLFQLASGILKQVFVHCDLPLLVIDYIQFVLRNVLSHRNSKNMTLDLYPTHLQSYVALLRIDSKYHTESSKKYILKSLSDMYLKNTEQVLILMLHYPNWLEELSNYVRDFI
ncbi:uncharacterized protein LOC107042355 [Diachasma alloeum]|uniref:uncharacterized protein LOC107042355 n=1 Tax=Diachasma alloeum TaxID=454923 RepID=UPI0007382598|nr:uncharacterized protein LOC107042355 [Diachasma alloeum]